MLRGPDHLPQLEFLCELARQSTKISDNVVTGCKQSVLGRNLAVSLYTKFQFVHKRVRDLVEIVNYKKEEEEEEEQEKEVVSTG